MFIDYEELECLYRDLESDRVERKASASDLDRIREAICAFANDLPGHGKPGVVFVGVHDDGGCADLSVDDALLTRLAGLRDDGVIHPIPSMTVQRVEIDGCAVAAIAVQPSLSPPVRFRGRVWISVGPTRRVASGEDERRLIEKRRLGNQPFDVQPVAGATLDDLDLYLFESEYLPRAIAPEVLEANDRTEEQQLRALRLVDVSGVPTIVGLLVLGKDPAYYLPGAYIHFLRMPGTGLGTEVLDDQQITGPITTVLWRIEELLKVHNQTRVHVDSESREQRLTDYPLSALYETIRNAVLHRNYEGTNAPVRVYWFDDRVEILSPGGPVGQVTPENFGAPGVTEYRNPHLAEAMSVLGFVQRFGIGIKIIRDSMARNGNPPPEFQPESNWVRVTLKKNPR